MSTGSRARRAGTRRWAATASTTRTPTCSPPRPAAPARSPTGSAPSPTTRTTFTEALSDQLVRADLVVTSGGVSKGTHDVVKEALAELGTVSFHEVAMQPGKPQGFGVIGEDATPIFTLPGNPVSAYVSFEVFVVPALRKMMGRTPYSRSLVRARADRAGDVAEGTAPVPARDLRAEAGRVDGDAGRRCRLAPARRAVPGERADRARRGRHRGRRRAPTSRCCCWTGTTDGRARASSA